MIKRKSVVTLIRNSHSGDFAGSSLLLLHHIIAVALSAAFVLSLPSVMRFAAKNVLVYWSLLADEKIFLTAIEVALAALIILFSHYVSRSWKDRKLASMALRAGLVIVTSPKGFLSRRRMKRLKEKQGLGRDVMITGSTGYRTFADP
ncbi:MAG TPA: hypothetical protein VJC03_05795, partial [bacterium]|nr:hypothetical protein [bacterium]